MDIAGSWIGELSGTNAGNFELDLSQQGNAVSGELRVSDAVHGLASYGCEGTVEDGVVTLELTPIAGAENVDLFVGKATGQLRTDGSIAGEWKTRGETVGSFVAVRKENLQDRSSLQVPLGAATAIRFQKETRLASCVVDEQTLRRLYRVLVDASVEAQRLQQSMSSQQAGRSWSDPNS